jgi:hypothetical protein
VTHIASKTSRGTGIASSAPARSAIPIVGSAARSAPTAVSTARSTPLKTGTPNGFRTTPTRSLVPGASRSGATWADCGSRGSGPRVSSSTARASATDRVSGPACDSSSLGVPGHTGIALSVGLSPTTPHHDAGILIDPPASLPVAIGTAPEATVAPDPELEPPEPRAGFHGLRVTPVRGEMPVPFQPNSGVVVFPITTAPARTSRPANGELTAAGSPDVVHDPLNVGSPARSALSLMATGTPCRALRGRPAFASASSAAASRSAASRRKKA